MSAGCKTICSWLQPKIVHDERVLLQAPHPILRNLSNGAPRICILAAVAGAYVRSAPQTLFTTPKILCKNFARCLHVSMQWPCQLPRAKNFQQTKRWTPPMLLSYQHAYCRHIYSNGFICLDILYSGRGGGWSPAMTMASCALSLRSMLASATRK